VFILPRESAGRRKAAGLRGPTSDNCEAAVVHGRFAGRYRGGDGRLSCQQSFADRVDRGRPDG